MADNSIQWEDHTITDPVQIKMVERLQALEGQKIEVARLPISQLKQQILLNEPQDPNQLLLPKSIGGSLIANEAIGSSALDAPLFQKIFE